MQAVTCKNCGHKFKGNFCNHCGEKVYSDHDKTFMHFADEAFHFITHFDSKILRSWWLVMTKPGFVSKQIADGIRKRYYKPVNLFIIGVILYLLFPVFQGLNMPMQSHRTEIYRVPVEYMIKKKMESENVTAEQLYKKFDSKSPKVAKLLLLIIIPLTGVVFQMLFRKTNFYFFDHLTLAAEVNTFYLYFTFLLMPLLFIGAYLIAWVFGADIRAYLDDRISIPLHVTSLGIYSTLAFMRFYGAKKLQAILKSALFLLAHWLIVYVLYKFILFCLVFLFI